MCLYVKFNWNGLFQRVVLGLTSRYRFYVNNTEVSLNPVSNNKLHGGTVPNLFVNVFIINK